ncbi:MAG: vanadium-dependent haloperoxidase, partial [Paracoccaceae bacterium]|nr:vanadium-dependent haloperoxidase [Paracoccaceae bacterium]
VHNCISWMGCPPRSPPPPPHFKGYKSSYTNQILKPENRNAVFHWLDLALQQTRDQRVLAPRAAYNFGLVTALGFLAANSIEQAYDEPYGIGSGPDGANSEVAYGVAFALAAGEAFQTPFMMEREAFLNRYPDNEAKTLGVEWGEVVARKLLDLRTGDGSEPSKLNYYLGRYQRRTDTLRWRPTGPFYSAAPGPAFPTFDRGLYPGLGKVIPWTMKTSSQFRVKEFYDPASTEFAEIFDLVRHLGGENSTIRTADEAEIALFWEDGPWGVTNPGHFIYIAIQLLQDENLSFLDLARAMALIGMTIHDAAISAWDNKYYYDILRPENAIRYRAPEFGNTDPRVVREPGWRSLIPTPEFPAYTSGHATFGGACMEMLALIIGRDDVSFSGRSPDEVLWPQLKNVSRHWTSLSQVAEENGMSRLYGGVHWDCDHIEGLNAGKAIAKQAFHTTFPRSV